MRELTCHFGTVLLELEQMIQAGEGMNINIPVANISKEDVAEVLLRVATILDLAGDNPYRSLAYRRAARLVLATTHPLSDYLTPRGRFDLPGLGANLRRKLGETAAGPRFLVSVRGVGVKLVDPT